MNKKLVLFVVACVFAPTTAPAVFSSLANFARHALRNTTGRFISNGEAIATTHIPAEISERIAATAAETGKHLSKDLLPVVSEVVAGTTPQVVEAAVAPTVTETVAHIAPSKWLTNFLGKKCVAVDAMERGLIARGGADSLVAAAQPGLTEAAQVAKLAAEKAANEAAAKVAHQVVEAAVAPVIKEAVPVVTETTAKVVTEAKCVAIDAIEREFIARSSADSLIAAAQPSLTEAAAKALRIAAVKEAAIDATAASTTAMAAVKGIEVAANNAPSGYAAGLTATDFMAGDFASPSIIEVAPVVTTTAPVIADSVAPFAAEVTKSAEKVVAKASTGYMSSAWNTLVKYKYPVLSTAAVLTIGACVYYDVNPVKTGWNAFATRWNKLVEGRRQPVRA